MTDVTPIPKALVTGPKARRPVNPESAKALAAREWRADCRSVVLARDRGRCAFHRIAARHNASGVCAGFQRPHGWSNAPEVHEVITRGRGGDPLDPDNCVTVCPWANVEVDLRQAGAEMLGLLLPSWATADHEAEARSRRQDLAALMGPRLSDLGIPGWRADDVASDFEDRARRDLAAWRITW